MKNVHAILLVALLLSAPGLLRAQDSDYQTYAQAAGVDLPLFRARVADVYGNNFNGTYLVDTLGFLPGEVRFEGKTYQNLSFHLDAVLQHVLMQQEGSPIILDLGLERVEYFTRGSRTYVNLASLGYDVPAGFYEKVADGRGAVYKRVDKSLNHLMDLNRDASAYIGYDDPHYRFNLVNYFQYKESWYWVKEDGTVQRLRSKRKVRNAIQSVNAHETH